MFRFHGLELCFLVLGKPGQRRHNKSNHHGHSNELHFESPFRIPSLILNRSVSQLVCRSPVASSWQRSEEHTSELQSRLHLVCRLLLEKKNRPAMTLDPLPPPHSPSSPSRNPFVFSHATDNRDSRSVELDDAADAKHKGLCLRCSSGAS